MITKLLNLFRRAPVVVMPRGGFNCFWADGLQCAWLDWDRRRVGGFTKPRPVVGDLLFAKMESGRTLTFVFTQVDHMHDVHDQYFATVRDFER